MFRLLPSGLLGAVACLAVAAAEPLLTAEELAAMERQNALWRLVRPEDEVEANVQRWRAAGHAEEDVARLVRELDALWRIEVERYYGWLDSATVERIKAVDADFIVRLRALRLREATGIEAGPPTPRTLTALNVLWRRAILRVLADDELAEYRLMNSAAARELGRLLEGIERTPAEDRRLFQLERDFQLAYADGSPFGLVRADRHLREARLDHLMALREVLGDGRFALFLTRADPAFADMRLAMAKLAPGEDTLAVELWRVRQKDGIDRLRHSTTVTRTAVERDAEVQSAARAVLGTERFEQYLQDDNGGWLVSVRRAPPPPSLSPRRP